jgi:hypothetical protein
MKFIARTRLAPALMFMASTIFCMAPFGTVASAAESVSGKKMSTDELSRELSNPNSPLATLTFKQIYTSFKGAIPDADNQSVNISLFQPVFPFPINQETKTNLFIRPAFSYVWDQPSFNAANNKWEDLSGGFADIGFDVAVGRSYESGVVVVGGVQGTLPTGADRLSADQWRLGPELVIAKLNKTHFYAIFPAHQWDVSGGDESYSTSQLEIYLGYYLPKSFTLMTDSKWLYDWKNDQATIPLNLTLSKVTKLGGTPVKFQIQADYFIEQDDDFGQDWSVSLGISPVVENFIYNAFNR